MTESSASALSERELFDAIDLHERRSEVDVRRLTETFLERIDASQERVNAFITVTARAAREQAEAAEAARRQVGALTGVRGMVIALKDDIDVAGVRCTVGSGFHRDRIAQEDAVVVRNLRDAGAVLIGKVGLNEWAYGVTCDNEFFGTIRNPWDVARIPGGSSGGSGAALAADLCIASLGSDAGGSVRIPAALNGVTGLRPTKGTVSGVGTHEISWALETVGPMARSARDVAHVLHAIRGSSLNADWARSDGAPVDLRGVRVGVLAGFFLEDVDVDIAAAVAEMAGVLESLGADTRTFELEGVPAVLEAGKTIIRAEALAIHEPRVTAEPEGYGTDVRARLLLGRDVTGAALARAYELGRVWTRRLTECWSEVDLLLVATTSRPACAIEGADMIVETEAMTRFALAFSIAGVPALSVPCGFTSERLPIGAQIIGPRDRDDLVLRAGVAYQHATSWHRCRPSSIADSQRAEEVPA